MIKVWQREGGREGICGVLKCLRTYKKNNSGIKSTFSDLTYLLNRCATRTRFHDVWCIHCLSFSPNSHRWSISNFRFCCSQICDNYCTIVKKIVHTVLLPLQFLLCFFSTDVQFWILGKQTDKLLYQVVTVT